MPRQKISPDRLRQAGILAATQVTEALLRKFNTSGPVTISCLPKDAPTKTEQPEPQTIKSTIIFTWCAQEGDRKKHDDVSIRCDKALYGQGPPLPPTWWNWLQWTVVKEAINMFGGLPWMNESSSESITCTAIGSPKAADFEPPDIIVQRNGCRKRYLLCAPIPTKADCWLAYGGSLLDVDKLSDFVELDTSQAWSPDASPRKRLRGRTEGWDIASQAKMNPHAHNQVVSIAHWVTQCQFGSVNEATDIATTFRLDIDHWTCDLATDCVFVVWSRRCSATKQRELQMTVMKRLDLLKDLASHVTKCGVTAGSEASQDNMQAAASVTQ